MKLWYGAGILNLMTLVLLATNARLILENLLKYGVLTSPARWIYFLYPNSEYLYHLMDVDKGTG